MNTLDSPVVLVFAGLDPTGGAGLQADIEAISSMGGHAAPIATCLTVQNTSQVFEVTPVAAPLLIEQARAVLEDMPVRAIKLGLLPDVEIIEGIHSLLTDYPTLPVILDPVLASGAGNALVIEGVIDAINALLLPMTTIVTPNSLEAARLAPGADTAEARAMALLDAGSDYVLITGTHDKTSRVINTLYGNHRKLDQYQWDRLEGSYHGSGCTLAAAIAGLVAHGQDVLSAIEPAQRYTWQSLKHGGYLGMGQKLPNRFFWTDNARED
ncbi:MAG TPA: hydroxymethylpyrimidine/phosphomethylpyrimidine kinase [Gammaproteobacteria bacterium]|nr:hydroxymethylpyrimidine/phosphomethylpyrimidine kinase [Gammaproteobacteria bacterium]